MTTSALACANLGRTFRLGGRDLAVLRGVDLDLPAGQRWAVVGPSGSGKSTLLGLIAGLDEPTTGRVVVLGQDLADLSPAALARFRGREIGFVFQSYRLLPHLTAWENVRVPLELAGRTDAATTAAAWLDRVGLGDRRDHRPARLSGGEQQRVALARALAPEPALVLADEPTGNLDSQTGAAIASLLFDLASDGRRSLLVVTHDPALAERCDRVVTMADGRVVDDSGR